MLKTANFLIVAIAMLSMAACNSGKQSAAPVSGEQTAKKAAAAAPEYETGRNAFQKLFVAARAFAPDIKPYRLESTYTPGAPVTEGKAGLWRGQFASPTKRAIKAYSWSGVGESSDRGVSHGTEDSYSPTNRATQVFELSFLKIDSDKALEVAQKHGGQKITSKNPAQPILYLLDFDTKSNELVWHIIYGESRNDAKLTIAVNATSGAFLRIEH